MINYSCGFAFDKKAKGTVLLLIKSHPEWQAGKCNGVGGHIEDGETPVAAMVREFNEEVGIRTLEEDWELFAVLQDGGEGANEFDPELPNASWRVFWFRAWLDFDKTPPKVSPLVALKTPEIPVFCQIDLLPRTVLNNVNWLVQMAYYGDESLPFIVIQQPQPEIAL